MNNQYKNFGDFIARKREENKITLREMARKLDISAPYLSDVEKDKRNSFDIDKLEQISKILELTDDEKITMYDLAGKKRNEVAPDLPEYIMDRDYVRVGLRAARDLDAGEKEWQKFVEDLKSRKE